MKRRLKHILRKNDGSIAVEFAFVGPILLLIIFGLIECGRLYFVLSNMQYAVDEVGRYAMIHKTADADAITTQVHGHLVAISPSSVTVTVEEQSINGKAFKQIALAHQFSSPVMAIVNWGEIPLNVQASIPVLP